MHIADAQSVVWSIADEHGWHEGEINVPERLALIHAEVSEALEDYRVSTHNSDLSVVEWGGGKPDGFAVELADIVIRVLDLAGQLDIDIESMMNIKMTYNASRPYRHGGKRA